MRPRCVNPRFAPSPTTRTRSSRASTRSAFEAYFFDGKKPTFYRQAELYFNSLEDAKKRNPAAQIDDYIAEALPLVEEALAGDSVSHGVQVANLGTAQLRIELEVVDRAAGEQEIQGRQGAGRQGGRGGRQGGQPVLPSRGHGRRAGNCDHP